MERKKILNKDCKYFPCHKGLEDCTFCYCPIYPCGYEEFGKFVEGKGGNIWDCSNCVIMHKSKIVEFILKNKDKEFIKQGELY